LLRKLFPSFVWKDILNRFNAVNKTLQFADSNLCIVIKLYESLMKFLDEMRTNFNFYEKEVIEKCEIKEYNRNRRRKRKIVDRMIVNKTTTNERMKIH